MVGLPGNGKVSAGQSVRGSKRIRLIFSALPARYTDRVRNTSLDLRKTTTRLETSVLTMLWIFRSRSWLGQPAKRNY